MRRRARPAASVDWPDFTVNPLALRNKLLEHDYEELAVNGNHALAAADLPRLHRDPFDRLLLAQAKVEWLTLLTTDATLARYPGPIILV